MRVLMISRPCLIGAYQRKLEEIAHFPDVELVVAVPSTWREGRSAMGTDPQATGNFGRVVLYIHLCGFRCR